MLRIMSRLKPNRSQGQKRSRNIRGVVISQGKLCICILKCLVVDGCLLEKLGYERLVLRSKPPSVASGRVKKQHFMGRLLVEIANLYVQGVLAQIFVEHYIRWQNLAAHVGHCVKLEEGCTALVHALRGVVEDRHQKCGAPRLIHPGACLS